MTFKVGRGDDGQEKIGCVGGEAKVNLGRGIRDRDLIKQSDDFA